MASSARALWKGAITFGLVHIPISLHPATSDSGLDFDWLDKRSMDPVGYKRINKRTGREITRENIVKGIEYEDGQYVVLTDAQISAAYPRATQTIEIEAFVKNVDIPFLYLDRPYYVAPIAKGAKVYALLRETLRRTNRIGIARVVIQTRQHLAALVPSGPALVLNLLRWAEDVRPMDALTLPPEGVKAANLNPRELAMAEQLVEDMSADWNPDDYRDLFKEEVMKLVEAKVKAGQTESVEQPQPLEDSGGSAQIIDLTELLQRSLKGGGKGAGKAAGKGGKEPDAGSGSKGRSASRKPASGSTGRSRTSSEKAAASEGKASAGAEPLRPRRSAAPGRRAAARTSARR
jgi:DNA end-binding protein Ku